PEGGRLRLTRARYDEAGLGTAGIIAIRGASDEPRSSAPHGPDAEPADGARGTVAAGGVPVQRLAARRRGDRRGHRPEGALDGAGGGVRGGSFPTPLAGGWGFAPPPARPPPLWPLLGAPLVWLVGDGYTALKLVSLVVGVGLIPLTYLAVRRHVGCRAALFAS